MNIDIKNDKRAAKVETELRKTAQFLMPAQLNGDFNTKGGYNIYPACAIGRGKIFNGFNSLAQYIIDQKAVVIDGYAGVFWDKIQEGLQACFAEAGLSVNWIKTADLLKPAQEVEKLIEPFLGEYESVWGTKTTLTLNDLYDTDITRQNADDTRDINIIIGTGAALADWDVPVIYIDLPKNELQFRMRAGSITNLGVANANEPFQMYKRFYFVDWVMLNNHKKNILERIAVVADGQWPGTINWMRKADLDEGLKKISQSVVRVRPWFEPGAWGGQWMKDNINNLNKDVVNLAWSFELIVPENGLVFESDGNLLEVSFDTLMFSNNQQILGKHADRFGDEFPIRFDFLDTFDGGNLSIQCHPTVKYIQETFGEKITQDETYYILDCQDNARVYLGFQDSINPEEFRNVLEESQETGNEMEIEKYVQSHPAQKHDLFLIPNSTVHSAGAGNMVLEISATPYIFTFKMYDWVRLDLEGNPRPINIDHAFNNLDFSRKGEQVYRELVSKPEVIEKGAGYQLVHVPTHAEHFYDVHRIEFDSQVTLDTNNVCHVMMLVEGKAVLLETADGSKHEFAYAETFVVPAAAGSYILTNLGEGGAKVIKAFLK
ncbi:class I mannose-6-phosphate isomerase [Mucilaginibacter sabulilitoris]|uniref:Class I mannose-6-phosphate isomerase n=1 Tax=Mucilaginibacter sabulilitoris TaxID=1173583 RepID=A0ABZ0TER9_9SPHI|nr:class I mannose-6-phosphate isomerase [Mucilaginibacter sabulilitoris]WPU91679.1 class I mannose-6-phosphate isomerase [Mucilaginibacter sabulilitoris]